MKASNKIMIFSFLVFLSGMLVLNILTPDREFSQRENRFLTARPEFTWKNVLSGRFTHQFEEYITDEFTFRDQWVLAKADVERKLLRSENNGIYFASGGYLLENFNEPGSALGRNIQQVNRFANLFNGDIHMVLAPNSVAIYPEKLPLFAGVYPQIDVMARVQQDLDGRVNFVHVYDTLKGNKEEYIYFRTDHHWTMVGAYYAYVELVQAMGLSPLGLEAFNRVTVSHDFWGTYSSRANNRYLQSDSIEVLLPKEPVDLRIEFNDREGVFDSLFFPEHLETRDKYSYFLDGNHPLTNITTDLDGERLLVLKDSFAHSLIPFLVSHFQEIHVIDLRFFNQGLEQYILDNGIQQVVFLYSVSGFSRDGTLTSFR